MSDGPDLICAGQAKAGTSWLFDQLQLHPDFWMPPIKELHYLDAPFPGPLVKRSLHAWRADRDGLSTRRTARGSRPLGDADDRFYELAASHEGLPLDLDRYAALFAFKGDRLSGDMTTRYGMLEPPVIRRLATRFPGLKVVILLREPVSRLWSHVCMQYRDAPLLRHRLDDPDALMAWVKGGVFRPHSYPTRIVSRWRRNFDPERVRWFFYEDISARPEWVRAEVMSLVGADPAKPSGQLTPAHNAKAGNFKLPIGAERERLFVELLRDELIACAEMFGGHARDWPKRYGIVS